MFLAVVENHLKCKSCNLLLKTTLSVNCVIYIVVKIHLLVVRLNTVQSFVNYLAFFNILVK